MAINKNNKAKLKTVGGLTLFGIIVGPLFTCIAFGFEIDRAIKGLVAGFLITFLSGMFEKFIYDVKLKKLNFSMLLFIRTLVYSIIISISVITVWTVHESLLNNRSLFLTLQTDDFRNFMTKGDFPYIFIFAITSSFLVNFLLQLSALLGKGVLVNYLTGKYHKPKMEERFFMFLDIESSTTIAETIGSLKYHEFMNNFFIDISDPVLENSGEIYQYVGDEVVISWKKMNGIKNCNCIKAYFDIVSRIDLLQDKYISYFGLIPGFKAGVHFGEVIIGEVGDSKKEIVFHGDVMNTASRVQGQAKTLNKQLLISEDALKYLNTGSYFNTVMLGKFKLKGKETETIIYEINKPGN